MATKANLHAGLKIGSGAVKIGAYGTAEGSCNDIGYSKGGITIETERGYLEVDVDNEVGILDAIKHMERVIVKVPFAETGDLDNLARALDYDPATYVSGGVGEFGGLGTERNLTMFVNIDKSDGGTRKFEFYSMIAIEGGSHTYTKDGQTIFEVTFLCLQDTTQTTNKQLFKVTDASSDTTAPTIAMTTPADGGTVTKDAKGTVLLTITEAGLMDENSIVYGNDDDATIAIYNVTTNTAITLVAGTIAYDSTAKTVTFTPTNNWTASDQLMVQVTTGLRDNAGNYLANTFIGHFSVTA